MRIKIYYVQGDKHCHDTIESNLFSDSGFARRVTAAYSALGVEVIAVHKISELEISLA